MENLNWMQMFILFVAPLILLLSVIKDKRQRKEYCGCGGCQNNESGWLSEEYNQLKVES